jgi:hypothetical protein
VSEIDGATYQRLALQSLASKDLVKSMWRGISMREYASSAAVSGRRAPMIACGVFVQQPSAAIAV